MINKSLVLNWLLQDVAAHAAGYYAYLQRLLFKRDDLNKCLYELNNRRDVPMPPALPMPSQEMIPVLRKHFNDNVTFISLVLNYYFPDQYLFYRVSKLEREFFDGLNFFSEVIPEFELPFTSVGRRGFEKYLRLNESLLKFSHTYWPKHKKPQVRVAYLHKLLGDLFLEKSDYHRYWIVATGEKYFERLRQKTVLWSARKEMQPGDLVFIYRISPRKAITDIFRVKEHPLFDPWGAWDGFWVHLEKICSLDEISFNEMRRDPVLSQWGVVRKHFQGTITEPVPHSIYNRLLEKISTDVRNKCGLTPEPVASVGSSGQFTSEAEFEERVVEPLLKRWAFSYQRQYPCLFSIGSQRHHTRVDFWVSDVRGPLTLFEDKVRILGEKELRPAVDQAKSYALLLGLSSFVVASPEGMRLYSLNKNREELKRWVTSDELKDQSQEEQFRNFVLALR